MDATKEILEFPGYEVVYDGQVYNQNTGRTLSITKNSHGVAIVGMMKGGKQHKRSLARLVADHFLDLTPRPAFNTPIHLDGDRFNCHVQNLAWRPMWFARAYHEQFKSEDPFVLENMVELMETGEVFNNAREAAQRFGLLEKEIVVSAFNNVAVFPTWQFFRLIEL